MTLPRNEQSNYQERDEIFFPQGSISGTTTFKVAKPKRAFVVEYVRYHSVAGLALDGSNYFVVSLKDGTTVIATIADTSALALTADAYVDGALGTVLNGDADDTLTLVCTKTGTQTLPAGTLRVGVRYI